MPTTSPEPPTEELHWFSWIDRQPPQYGALDELLGLIEAVHQHQQVTSHVSIPKRPGDHALYRRLAEIEDSVPALRRRFTVRDTRRDGFQLRGH